MTNMHRVDKNTKFLRYGVTTTIKNSDLHEQEFQHLAKTKEIRNGDPVLHAFWALYSPLALCSMYPMHYPLSPICLQYNLRAKKWRPSCFHKYLPPQCSDIAFISRIQMQKC